MNPLETGLYGDVVAAGGLDLAIARAARERKLDIGVSRRSGDPGEAFRQRLKSTRAAARYS